MRKTLFLLLLFFSFLASAQRRISITGSIVGEENQAIPFATVSLLNPNDSSVVVNQFSREDGNFVFQNLLPKDYLLKTSVVGYISIFQLVIFDKQETVDVGKVSIKSAENILNEVVIKGNKEPIAVKKDTLEFDASVLKSQQNDNLEDLLKKVPALEIDENGGMKTQNKVVRKIYVDGKEFFGNDPQLALKNLPAEAIDKIQVIEKKTDQAEFSGVDDGEREMVVNVTLKNTHKKGIIGFASAAGVPPLGSTEGYYNAKTSVSRFSPSKQFSVIGLFNNLNQQSFTPQDAANFSSLNAQSNRGGGNGGGGSANVNLPIVVGKRPGIIATEGAGFNYNNQYAKKSSLQSSYFFNTSHTDLVRNLLRQSFLPTKTINTDQNTRQNRDNQNHRINATLTHQFDERNNIKLITGFNTVSGNASSNSLSKINTITAGNAIENNANRKVFNHSQGLSFNNSVLLRHRFGLPRRTISLNGVLNFNQDKNNDSTNTINQNQNNGVLVERVINQENDRQTSQQNRRLQVAFTEPLSKNGTFEANYAYQQNLNRSDFRVWDIVNGSSVANAKLSNAFNSNFNFQQIGFKINNEAKEKTFMVGIFYQKSVLESIVKRGTDNALERSFQNILPSIRYSFRKDANKGKGKEKGRVKSNSTTFEYNTAVNEPSVRDLQPITVNNNPQNITLGNPDLKPEYIHRLLINKNIFNAKTFTSFGANGNVNYTQNAISYAQTVSETLVRTTQPVNLPYRWNANVGINYGFAIGKQKNKLRLNLSPRYLVSQGNSVVNNITNLNTQNQFRAEFKVTYLTDKINFVLNTNYQKSFVEYSVNKEFNQNFVVFKNTTDFRWKITKEFTFATDFDYTYYQSSRLTTNLRPIPILNVAAKYLFLKNNRGELMLSVQDLLKRNIYLSQRSDENFFEIDRSNTLSRYFLLTFTYTVRNQEGRKNKSNLLK